MENIIKTNNINVENVRKALETNDRQSKTVLENAETVNRMAGLMERQQSEFMKERKKNEELQKDNNQYKAKLISSMSSEIVSQKEKIKRMEEEKKRIAARAAEYESQVRGLKTIYDGSQEDIKALEDAMMKMEKEYGDNTSLLLEKLRKSDVAMIQQAVDLAAIRFENTKSIKRPILSIFRVTLLKLDEENQTKLENIIQEETKKDEEVLAAAKDIMEMLRDPDVITNFLG